MRMSLAGIAIVMILSAPAAAQTVIPPGQTFLVGGEQPRSLRVAGRNIGKIPVRIAARTLKGVSERGMDSPGANFIADFAPGETAAISNSSSSKTAEVDITMTKLLFGMSMRYTGPGADGK